jgi:hypothetical protein
MSIVQMISTLYILQDEGELDQTQPNLFIPTQEWENRVIDQFSNLRTKMDRWRDLIEDKQIQVPLPSGIDLVNF